MQNAKDTFFATMQARLAAINPERVIVLAGAIRPALLVEENELPTEATPADCFRMRWTEAKVDAEGTCPLVTMHCDLVYATAGSTEKSGLDRGRVLAAMDAEIIAMMNLAPQNTTKINYAPLTTGGEAAAMRTNLWWSDVRLGEVRAVNQLLERTAQVAVMCLEEESER
ncbi:MAG: hypothetical protein PW735_09105 [Acidobacteriaceae bacterium]|nr:hypothetical protein [Acidobacteriaceae bacterium]